MSRFASPMCALLVVLAMGAACGREPSGAVPVQSSPSQVERAEMKLQLETQLRRELEPQIRAEVRAELKDEIRAEVRAEMARATEPTRLAGTALPPTAAAPDTVEPDAPETPDANAVEPTAIDGQAPIWARPGSVINPYRAGIKLLEVTAGTGLEDKSPTDVKLAYDKVPELLYCYTVFENPAPETTITHVWRRGSRLVSRVELEVGNSPKWKTWSKQRTQAHWTGLWSCEVLGPEGQQLGATAFKVGAQ